MVERELAKMQTELRAYLQSLPEDRRPSQVPYPNNQLLAERLADGTLSNILVWELAPLYAVTEGRLDGAMITAVFEPPFAVPPLQFSAAMLRQDTFVRGLIDQAIEELTASGELDRIASDHLPRMELIPALGGQH